MGALGDEETSNLRHKEGGPGSQWARDMLWAVRESKCVCVCVVQGWLAARKVEEIVGWGVARHLSPAAQDEAIKGPEI